MITRAQMPRQLRDKGGIASVTPRENYGLGSKIKDRFRKLIPNELADVAVAAAPFVAPFNPGIAGLMRGIGRFDQRGSISDALKQGAATFGFGAGARALGGADPFGGGLKGGFTSPLDAEKTTKFKTLFERQKADIDLTKTKDKPGFLRKAAEETIGKVPVLQNLSPKVQEKLLAGTITSGASALYSYFTGEFEPQQPGETVGEYLARRNERVKLQMRQVMDSYYTPLRNPEYAAMTPEQKNNFIDGLVGQAGLKGTTDFQGEARATGGRVGYQTGGITMANTLAENIARNRAAQAAFQQSIAPARERVKEQIRKRTPVQEYAISDDSILGPLSKQAASTIMEGQDRSQAALDVLNQTMTPTTDTGIMTQAPTTDTAQISGAMDSLINVNKQPTQNLDNIIIDRNPNKAYADGDVIPGTDGGILGAFKKPDGNILTANEYNKMRFRPTMADVAGPSTSNNLLSLFERYKDIQTPVGADPNNPDFVGETALGNIEKGVKEFLTSDIGLKYGKDIPSDIDDIYSSIEAQRRAFSPDLSQNYQGGDLYYYLQNFYKDKYGLASGGMPTGIMKTNKAGVMERDYRDKGGFVPVGIKEKADDVPAMLSKNEFVFTADAVRGAGNGSIEKGAQRMYDTMKNLEKRVT
jgi:hypothetical protein